MHRSKDRSTSQERYVCAKFDGLGRFAVGHQFTWGYSSLTRSTAFSIARRSSALPAKSVSFQFDRGFAVSVGMDKCVHVREYRGLRCGRVERVRHHWRGLPFSRFWRRMV